MPTKTKKHNSLLKTIGPGFLLAGAAIGVSHLVQATRAGADYGLILMVCLVLACISKYPFLEFGPRYFSATGKNLISGYKELGKFPYYTYMVITFGTMFVIQAAVTIVTAGLAEHLFQLGLSPFVWSFIILGACILLLLIGKYKGLDLSMKVIITLLALATLFAVLMASQSETAEIALQKPSVSFWNVAGLAFIIAFMGWMPIPIDASIWHSIWSKAKFKETKVMPRQKDCFTDFNVGYLSAAFIGVLFFLLGFFVMFGTDMEFSSNSVEFSAQLIDLYGASLGAWSEPIIAIAAFITMLSTTLAVTDAYPRVVAELFYSERTEEDADNEKWKSYRVAVFAVPILSLLILYFMSGSFTTLIDFAAGLSFLSAPFLGWFNYRLVTQRIQESFRPKKPYRVFSLVCIALLIAFNLLYLYWVIFI